MRKEGNGFKEIKMLAAVVASPPVLRHRHPDLWVSA